MDLSIHTSARSVLQKIADKLNPLPVRARKEEPAPPEPQPPLQYAPADVADALYRGILDRAPDQNGLSNLVDQLESGKSIDAAAKDLLSSSEFMSTVLKQLIPPHQLPDLVQLHPERYERETTSDGVPLLLFKADSDADFDFMEHAIAHHRYYDGVGVWGVKIDLDKRITAALVQGMGATSCLELGCFTGAVISQLEEAGVDVVGLDVSHVAFALAYQNIKHRMVFADLLTARFERRFDVVLAMDIIEHLNPVKFDQYISAIAALVSKDGYFYLNSPMFGADDVFGQVFGTYVSQWQAVGEQQLYGRFHCDELGWPLHGHLVWASPVWWEQQFAAHGLVRDRTIERAIHAKLGAFFSDTPARKSLFVLKHKDNARDVQEVINGIHAALDKVLSD
ncbi:methyltransferase domain-containing protein [Duganella sp. FT80W]|uniref:Methyltransferase domain-containing protein n=1 Tax=Duganella guangzhouensis TaxID=2666084 RepID=A0A6I2L726_9BURK|nr:methyltransferase domain-containing protein [Duganella guangzhouensis]MRW93452.1 methyltransferase domain-containing protein [Duganella guangzhouensis]